MKYEEAIKYSKMIIAISTDFSTGGIDDEHYLFLLQESVDALKDILIPSRGRMVKFPTAEQIEAIICEKTGKTYDDSTKSAATEIYSLFTQELNSNAGSTPDR